MAVFLDPIENGGWLDLLRSNGAAGAEAYGRFVGRRFPGFRDVVWLSGNDCQTWKDGADDALVRAVAAELAPPTRGRFRPSSSTTSGAPPATIALERDNPARRGVHVLPDVRQGTPGV